MRSNKLIIGMTLACLSLCAQAGQTSNPAPATKAVDLTPKTDGFDAIFAQWAQESATSKAPASAQASQKK